MSTRSTNTNEAKPKRVTKAKTSTNEPNEAKPKRATRTRTTKAKTIVETNEPDEQQITIKNKQPPTNKQPTSSCTDPNTILNESMIEYMDSILKINKTNNIIKDELFTGDVLDCVNSSIRNGNYYMLDKYGLPIRKNFQDSRKSAFGWKYNSEQQPINIHINDILLQTESDDIQIITLQQLKTQFPSLFKAPRGIIYKIYSTEFPEINIDAL